MSPYIKYIFAIAVVALTACSNSDSEEPTEPTSPVMMISCGGSGIDMWQATSESRAGELAPPEQDSIHSVGVFAINTTAAEAVFTNQSFYNRNSPLPATANYEELKTTWPATNDWLYMPQKTWVTNAQYVFLGYSPYSAGHATIVQNAENEIAEFTWDGLSSVSATDLLLSTCVGYQAIGVGNPALPLPMKHLLARLRFCFQLGPHYSALRKIVVKEMRVIYPDSRQMSLTVSYAKDGTEYTPTYRWQREDLGTGETNVQLRNEKGVESITLEKDKDYQPLASLYYQPGDQLNNLSIEVVYDVYDVSNNTTNLLRANDHAVSVISMLRTLEAGKYYDVKIQIEPSYLYVLSDNDTDADGTIIIQ